MAECVDPGADGSDSSESIADKSSDDDKNKISDKDETSDEEPLVKLPAPKTRSNSSVAEPQPDAVQCVAETQRDAVEFDEDAATEAIHAQRLFESLALALAGQSLAVAERTHVLFPLANPVPTAGKLHVTRDDLVLHETPLLTTMETLGAQKAKPIIIEAALHSLDQATDFKLSGTEVVSGKVPQKTLARRKHGTTPKAAPKATKASQS